MEAIELKACIRKESGKGPARRFRKKGLIPAVFYGRGEEAILLSVNAADLLKIIKDKEGKYLHQTAHRGRETSGKALPDQGTADRTGQQTVLSCRFL